jgi:hypothetical protein
LRKGSDPFFKHGVPVPDTPVPRANVPPLPGAAKLTEKRELILSGPAADFLLKG